MKMIPFILLPEHLCRYHSKAHCLEILERHSTLPRNWTGSGSLRDPPCSVVFIELTALTQPKPKLGDNMRCRVWADSLAALDGYSFYDGRFARNSRSCHGLYRDPDLCPLADDWFRWLKGEIAFTNIRTVT